MCGLHICDKTLVAWLSIEAYGAGGAGLGEGSMSTAAATATFRASTAGSPVASAPAARHMVTAGKAPHSSPPVNVVEILARSPARSVAAARPGPAGAAHHLHTALEEAQLPLQSDSRAGGRRAGRSGTATLAGAPGGENAAPGGAGDANVKETKSTTAAAAQPVPGAAEAKAVRKGKWQSRKNTNAIFVSLPGFNLLAHLSYLQHLSWFYGVVLTIET